MFCRIGLELSEQKNVRLLIEADHRLFCRFLNIPTHTSADVVSAALRGLTVADRKVMVRELPKLAETHETAWKERDRLRKELAECESAII